MWSFKFESKFHCPCQQGDWLGLTRAPGGTTEKLSTNQRKQTYPCKAVPGAEWVAGTWFLSQFWTWRMPNSNYFQLDFHHWQLQNSLPVGTVAKLATTMHWRCSPAQTTSFDFFLLFLQLFLVSYAHFPSKCFPVKICWCGRMRFHYLYHVCLVQFDVDHQGPSALKSHLKSQT